MKFAVQTIWWGFKESSFQFGRLIVLNLTWIVFCLPLITIPAATLAMTAAIKMMVVDENEYSLNVFFTAFKRYFFSSWRWFLPAVLIPAVFIYNILFFAVESYTLSMIVQAGNLVLLLIWCFLQMFTLPFLVENEQPVMRTALMDGVRMLYTKPGLYWFATLALSVFMILSLVLITPVFVFSVSMSGFVAMYCLQVYLGRRGQVAEEDEYHQPKTGKKVQ